MKPLIYSEARVVTKADIDELGHVNNVVYLQYLQDLAINHWYSKAPKQITDTLRWIVKKHDIEYFYPAKLGDELLLKTWISSLKGVTSERQYEIHLNERLVVKASTLWVSVNPISQRPQRIDITAITPYFFEG